MKKPLVLTSLLVLLAGCATQSHVTVRRGRIIKFDEPAPVAKAVPAPMPAPVVVKPTPAPAPKPVVVTTPAVTQPTAPAPKPVAPAPAPTPVVVVPSAPVVSPALTAPAAPIVTKRNGAVVDVSWSLPASDIGYKAVEIMRNDRSEPQGRTRVRAVRATVTNLQDTVPDATGNYWYWIKLTRTDGQVQNIGPVAAPQG